MAGQVNKSKLDSITRGIMVFMTGGRDFIGPRTVAPGSPGLMFEKDSYVHFGQKEGNFNRGIPPVRLRPENRGMAGQEMPDTVYLAPDSTDRYPFSGQDRAKHRTFAPRSACRLTQAAYRQAHEKNCRAFVSNAGPLGCRNAAWVRLLTGSFHFLAHAHRSLSIGR
jgi:hypothetical protein